MYGPFPYFRPSAEEWYPRIRVESTVTESANLYCFFLNGEKSEIRWAEQPLGPSLDSHAYEYILNCRNQTCKDAVLSAIKTAMASVFADRYYEQTKFTEDIPIYDPSVYKGIVVRKTYEKGLSQWDMGKLDMRLDRDINDVRTAVGAVFGFDIKTEMVEFITRVGKLGSSVFETQTWLSLVCYRSQPKPKIEDVRKNKRKRSDSSEHLERAPAKRPVFREAEQEHKEEEAGPIQKAHSEEKQVDFSSRNGDGEDIIAQQADSPRLFTLEASESRSKTLSPDLITKPLSQVKELVLVDDLSTSQSPQIQTPNSDDTAAKAPPIDLSFLTPLNKSLIISSWLRLQLPETDTASREVVREWLTGVTSFQLYLLPIFGHGTACYEGLDLTSEDSRVRAIVAGATPELGYLLMNPCRRSGMFEGGIVINLLKNSNGI